MPRHRKKPRALLDYDTIAAASTGDPDAQTLWPKFSDTSMASSPNWPPAHSVMPTMSHSAVSTRR